MKTTDAPAALNGQPEPQRHLAVTITRKTGWFVVGVIGATVVFLFLMVVIGFAIGFFGAIFGFSQMDLLNAAALTGQNLADAGMAICPLTGMVLAIVLK